MEKEKENDSNYSCPLGVRGSHSSPLGNKDSSYSSMFYGALPIHFELAKKLRDNQTEAEVFLWTHLGKINISGVRFKRQHPILYFIADFYCHKSKLIIEVDGGYHALPEQYEYDINREAELESLGLKVIRFSNEQVLFDIENTIKIIEKEVVNRISINYL